MAQKRRSYKVSDLKRLFALSRNACAFPMCEQPLARPEWPSVQCEIAHIYDLNPGSARHVAGIHDNSIDNLILLCPNHHNLIDNLEPDRFPPDVLLEWKMAHERVKPVGWQPTDAQLDDVVQKLAVRLHLTLTTVDQREPIRSDPSRTADIERRLAEQAAERHREERGDPPPSTTTTTRNTQSRRRVSIVELGDELAMSADAVLALCETLGIPAKTVRSTLQEPYADMVRRRAVRDGLTGGHDR